MTGLGGLNPSPGALVLGLLQAQVPVVTEPEHVLAAAERVAALTRGAKEGLPTLDLVVFPEYSLNGLNPQSWLDTRLLCDLDGPEIELLRTTYKEVGVWGCFSLMERNPDGAPFNSGLIVNDNGDVALYYRKMHPWVPLEPWQPGDLGMPVCDGPAGSKLALAICHDGMLPEVAREAAYRGANVLLRTAGYTYPIQHSWRITNQANAFSNLLYTASVCLAGPDSTGIWSQGEAMVCDIDGTVLEQGDGFPDRVVTAEVVPSRADPGRRRAAGLGRGKQHLPARAPWLRRRRRRGHRLPVQLHAGPGGRALPGAVGGRGRRHRRAGGGLRAAVLGAGR
jgi:formamidase